VLPKKNRGYIKKYLLLLLRRTSFEAQIMIALMLRDGQIERRVVRAAAGINSDLFTFEQRLLPV
jgi:hypothetical protein